MRLLQMKKNEPKDTVLPLDFDPNAYLAIHQDVKKAGIDPITHYLTYGRKEGRMYKTDNPKSFEDTLGDFLTVPPSEQNAFDLFPTAWSSTFDGVDTSGNFRGADDARLKWLFRQVDFKGKSVLELGPLEAGHTCMMEKAGASVLGIESNKGAFIRCLIAKNYLDLSAKFLLGDFEKMNFSGQSYDIVIASGILYHMKDPVGLLKAISKTSDKLFIWTHYFEPNLSKWNHSLAPLLQSMKWKHKEPIIERYEDMDIRMVRQDYGEALGWSGFCGGSDIFSNWVYREDLLKLLRKLGFKQIEISFEDLQHQNGPSFCLLCEK
jgi:hypothetical protein